MTLCFNINPTCECLNVFVLWFCQTYCQFYLPVKKRKPFPKHIVVVEMTNKHALGLEMDKRSDRRLSQVVAW